MPLRSRGPLLIGVTAVLGLWATGSGCQSDGVRPDGPAIPPKVATAGDATHHDAFAIRPRNADGAPPASQSAVVLGTPVPAEPRPSLLTRLRRQPPADGPTLVVGAPCEACNTPTATMLRPVPASTGQVVVASSWQPVQRGPGESDGPLLNGGAGHGASGVVPASSTMPLGPPTPLPIATADNGVTGEGSKGEGNNKGQENESPLPQPRRAPGWGFHQGGHPAAPGYPQLPDPLIPHPPDAPRELAKKAYSAYVIEPPDILIVQATGNVSLPSQPIGGPHLVRPDGTIGLGIYGSVFVAGMTIEEAKMAVAHMLQLRQPKKTIDDIVKELFVDVAAYNSKFYYVITDGAGYGEQVYRIPCTGNETVLDALSQIQGLPPVSTKHRIWVARATPDAHDNPHILPVDYCAVAKGGSAATNYQIFPGDRIYVDSNKLISFNSRLGQFLAPIERILGVTLLGSSVVNSIKNGNNAAGVPGR